MWNIPRKERLAKIPKLCETEKIPPQDKLIYLHFFIANCDWYIAEYDREDLFWGFCILGGDMESAEWGYVSFSELKSIKIDRWLEVDSEPENVWQPRSASEITKIRVAHGWLQENDTSEDTTKEQELILKVKSGHFEHFQNLFEEVTSPYSDFFGIDPYHVWEVANGFTDN